MYRQTLFDCRKRVAVHPLRFTLMFLKKQKNTKRDDALGRVASSWMNRLTNQITKQSTNQSVNQSINQSPNQARNHVSCLLFSDCKLGRPLWPPPAAPDDKHMPNDWTAAWFSGEHSELTGRLKRSQSKANANFWSPYMALSVPAVFGWYTVVQCFTMLYILYNIPVYQLTRLTSVFSRDRTLECHPHVSFGRTLVTEATRGEDVWSLWRTRWMKVNFHLVTTPEVDQN